MPDINKTDLADRLMRESVDKAEAWDAIAAKNAIIANQAAEISRLRDALAMIDLIMEEAAKDNSPYGRSDGMALGRIRQLLGLNPATGAARTALEANHG